MNTTTATTRRKLLTNKCAASTVRQTTCRRQAALSPDLRGHRAAVWVSQWDRAPRSVRTQLLESFIQSHGASNVSTMMADMGDAAPLLFTRLTSWFRLIYRRLRTEPPVLLRTGDSVRGSSRSPPKQPTKSSTAASTPPQPRSEDTSAMKPLDGDQSTAAATPTTDKVRTPPPTLLVLVLQCIGIMIRGTSFMTQLVESGMAATLTDCLECGSIPADAVDYPYVPLTKQERMAVLFLLLYICNAGRVYREMVCDPEGLVSLLHALQRERDTEVAALLTELLMLLGKGNPLMAPLVHCGLMRLILSFAEEEQKEEEAGKVAGYAQPRVIPVEGLERSVSQEVVLHSARVLRGLQCHKEAHHQSNCKQRGEEEDVQLSSIPAIDLVPVVCLGANVTPVPTDIQPARLSLSGPSSVTAEPLLGTVDANTFLSALFYLVLHDNPQFRGEGSELLALVAKNVELLTPILNQCFDVVDDNLLEIVDEDDARAIARCQRRQLSCGRAAVQIILCKDCTTYRFNTIMNLIAVRSAHMTLLKYLRMADQGDAAAVVDCCRAVQLIARTSDERQRVLLQKSSRKEVGGQQAAVLRIGHAIRDAVGGQLYQVLIHQQLTNEECFAVQRAVRATATARQ